MHRLVLHAFVPGVPRSKGSLKPQRVRGGGGVDTGRTRLVDTPQSKAWRRTMAKAFLRHWAWAHTEPLTGPVVVSALFYFDRDAYPGAVDMDYPIHPHIGDLDKLLRNLCDALQVDETGEGNGAGIIADDRQVVDFASSRKVWTRPGELVGVSVEVWEV